MSHWSEIEIEDLTEFRKALRTELLGDQILGAEQELIIELEFAGSGDSGDWCEEHENPKVMALFQEILDHHVSINWWDNEGGGGSVSWDVVANKITIESYYNVTAREDQPTTIIDSEGEFTDESETLEPVVEVA